MPAVLTVAALFILELAVAHTQLRVRLLTRGTRTFARVTTVPRYGNQALWWGFRWPVGIAFLDEHRAQRTSTIAVWSLERGGVWWGRPDHLVGQDFPILHNGEPDVEVCRVWPKWLIPIVFIWVEAHYYVAALLVLMFAFDRTAN